MLVHRVDKDLDFFRVNARMDTVPQIEDVTMALAKSLHASSPGMTFCYVSGAGTDSSEKGRMM